MSAKKYDKAYSDAVGTGNYWRDPFGRNSKMPKPAWSPTSTKKGKGSRPKAMDIYETWMEPDWERRVWESNPNDSSRNRSSGAHEENSDDSSSEKRGADSKRGNGNAKNTTLTEKGVVTEPEAEVHRPVTANANCQTDLDEEDSTKYKGDDREAQTDLYEDVDYSSLAVPIPIKVDTSSRATSPYGEFNREAGYHTIATGPDDRPQAVSRATSALPSPARKKRVHPLRREPTKELEVDDAGAGFSDNETKNEIPPDAALTPTPKHETAPPSARSRPSSAAPVRQDSNELPGSVPSSASGTRDDDLDKKMRDKANADRGQRRKSKKKRPQSLEGSGEGKKDEEQTDKRGSRKRGQSEERQSRRKGGEKPSKQADSRGGIGDKTGSRDSGGNGNGGKGGNGGNDGRGGSGGNEGNDGRGGSGGSGSSSGSKGKKGSKPTKLGRAINPQGKKSGFKPQWRQWDKNVRPFDKETHLDDSD